MIENSNDTKLQHRKAMRPRIQPSHTIGCTIEGLDLVIPFSPWKTPFKFKTFYEKYRSYKIL